MNRFSRKGHKGSTASQNFSLRLCVSALKQIRIQLQLKTTANHVHLVNSVKRIPGNGVESFCLARSSLSSAKFFWEGSIAKPDESLRTLRSLRRKEGLVEGVEEL